ncbi:SDR family oxidoreductase [Robbsia sp. KACC 23696]|uniref:SDR family oxidoreductase n=1 Tax=Robbsia sp. KACC 23696 TaxID=3149231 RepID=UPI00325AB17B
MPTVLITGCSSGFGLEIARHFLAQEWHVVATMRTPRDDVLPKSDRLRILPLDVTDADSIRQAVADAGPLDALVNNAGVGAGSPSELTPMATIRDIFETNTFGTIAMMQAVLPQFRQRRSGVVVNVTSSITYKATPFAASYRASKAAVNAFTEAAALEVASFGIRMHIVLPGRAPETRFLDNGKNRIQGMDDAAYGPLIQQIFDTLLNRTGPVTYSRDVAEAVWQAITEPATPLHIPAGLDAKESSREAHLGGDAATTR